VSRHRSCPERYGTAHPATIGRCPPATTPPNPGARDHDPDAFLERFDWHPEPGLVGYRDEAQARAAMEALGHETWAAALDFLYDEAGRRAMGAPSGYDEARQAFFGDDRTPATAPRDPSTSSVVLGEFTARLAAAQMNSQHPRQFGYFTPPPLPMSIMGELLTQVTNQGIDVWHAGPSGAFVEEEVIRWLCDLVGYGPDGFGILTSGGVMANFMAMLLARDLHLGRLRGLGGPPRGADLDGARVYVSDQAHFSIARALDELGFPSDTLVVLPSDDRFRLQAAPVSAAIARDRAAGRVPFAIAAVAGSTNTGSIDAIGDLATLAAAEDLWLHVDAAYGGAVRLSSRDASRITDLGRAHSVTVDPHKWFFQAYDIGGLLVRDATVLAAGFGGRSPEYYRGGEGTGAGATAPADDDHDDHAGQLNFYKLGFEGTRRWRALKLWMSWKHLGTSGFGRLIDANMDLAAHLAAACAASDDFEAVPAEPDLSVVCFRHLPGGRAAALAMDPAELDAHQDALQASLERSGDGWLTTTRLRGATYLRAGIVNYLSTEADIDRLLATLRRLAA
jgi:glutamate/tyrosine decarboxylase-like PLP-dependent enzyme